MSPSSPPPDPLDPYARVSYRRLIAWPERIRREAPFLDGVAGRGPERSVLDLGCGTGEHARFFAERGYRTLGVDASEAQIEAATDSPLPPHLRFVVGDLARLDQAVREERFGTALCLGNTLVHLLEPDALARCCRGVHDALLPGGAWVTQILNYERLRARNERTLPVNVREASGEDVVFLRCMRYLSDGRVQFVPASLRLRFDADPPLEIQSARVVELRGWMRRELEPALRDAGFDAVAWHGDMQGGPFAADRSADLVFVATRR